MHKNTSNNLPKRLLQYGAMSAAVLGAADVNGQIVYTDVDPDVDLIVGDQYVVDITGSANEFTLSNPSGLAGGNAALIFPSSGGAFVGSTAYGFMYPALLAEGALIDGAAGYTTPGIRGDLNYYGCAYSNSQWCDTVVDGYIGISFTFSGNTHYGWIRLDTDVNGTNIMTVKDFAYNATPGAAINAGDNDLSVAEFSARNIKVVALNKSIGLYNLPETTNYTLYNVAGQKVLDGKINGSTFVVEANSVSSGVYIIEIIDSNTNATLRKKVVL